jgi:hypothetical protein
MKSLRLALMGGALALAAAAHAQTPTMTGQVLTPGGAIKPLAPVAQFSQACNGNNGGLVGQVYNGVTCGAPPPSSLPASGVSAVTATISSASASGSFTPQGGRAFHVQLSGTASAACYLERQLDGATWVPLTVTASGITTILYNWSYVGSALSEDVVEAQYGVPYRVDCGAQLGSFTSGALAVRISQ